MKPLVPLAALALLCACSQEAAKPTASTASLTIEEAAGIYYYTLADGVTTLLADGSFTDMMGGGTVKGTWDVDNSRICLDPAGEGADRERKCYRLGEPDANGLQTATSDTGELVKIVKRRADLGT